MLKKIENTMSSGTVYAIAKPEKGRDFGLSLVVTLGESSFFVVKYGKARKNEVKSIKYWTGISIEDYSKFNTKRELVKKNEKGMNLEQFLSFNEKKDVPKGLFKGILKSTQDFIHVMENDLSKVKFHSYYGKGKADDESKDITVTRMAFTSNTDLNAVVKTFVGGSSDGVLSIKFDYTNIDIMSKEWNMTRIAKDDEAISFLESLGDKLEQESIDELEEKKFTSEPGKKRKLYLISMLPGLGKSTIAKGNSNVLDYEDWMEKGLRPYKTDKRPAEDIEKMIIDMTNEGKKEDKYFSNLYIMSSIHWESMMADLKTDIFVHMNIGEYNCEEVISRGRKDLCDLIGDETLLLWNEDYFRKIGEDNSLTLKKGAYLSIGLLDEITETAIGYDVLGEDTDSDAESPEEEENGEEEIVHDEEEELLIENSDDLEVEENHRFDFNNINQDKLFKFKDIDNEYYIIEDRAVIVFQFKSSDTYAYWDVLGKEDHRLIVSAKGPFDNKLEVKPGESWLNFRYDKDSFIEKIGISEKDIISLFAGYSTDWAENTRQVQIFLKYTKPKDFK